MGGTLTEEQYRRVQAFLADEEARLSLFWILDKDGRMRRFEPNWAQRELGRGLGEHTRHLVLKARQLGISTFSAMYALGQMMFCRNWKGAIIDKTQEDGEEKIDKMRFAYEHLDYVPEGATKRDLELAEIGRMLKEYHGELANKAMRGRVCVVSKAGVLAFMRTRSSIRARVTYRGGTIQFLHVSELGHMSVKEPKRAREVVTGSYNSAGKNCTIIAESTHEGGKEGVHYEQVLAAMDNIGKVLNRVQFRFWFFPWFRDPGYVIEERQELSEADREYFAGVERSCNVVLRDEQKYWYVSMQQTQRSLMRQEYPSTPDEALSPIMDGTIFARQVMALRESGDLTRSFEPDRYRPIYTAWDIGYSDFTSIWWFQPTGDGRWLVLDNYTANREEQAHYIDVMREHDARWGRCACVYLPHDGGSHNATGTTYAEGLRRAGYTVRAVRRRVSVWEGIDNARDLLRQCVFHKRCSEPTRVGVKQYLSGVEYLTLYRTENERMPLHDDSSHAADAFRTFADAIERGIVAPDRGYEPVRRKPGRMDRVVEDYLD